jgi:hypothetical protein
VKVEAVIPVAFYTARHVEMTRRFLGALYAEGIDATVYDHGGSVDGSAALDGTPVVPARSWPFYRIWNRGIRDSSAEVVLVLNNDIEWPAGALVALTDALAGAEPHVAICSPDEGASELAPAGVQRWTRVYGPERGITGWCFAARPDLIRLTRPIDEGYVTWYGADELVIRVETAGYHCARAMGVPVFHPHPQTTTAHRPDFAAEIERDGDLFHRKWGRR